MQKFANIGAIMVLAATQANADKCKAPLPSKNFTRDGYEGVWYEVAKFQTAGGAYFEKDCVCTELNVIQGPGTKYSADNICRYQTPSGKVTSAVGDLKDENPSGHFKESFAPLAPAVDYTIILMGELNGDEYSVEYDCGSNILSGTNYCVHFLARSPTMSETTLNYLIDEVNKLELNTQNLPLQMTMQEGCWEQTFLQ